MDLSPVEEESLLALLLIGDSLPVTISEFIDRHPASVSRSVARLGDRDLVVEKDRAVYSLSIEGYSVARGILRER
jgi:predicted transcriptional regulator